MSSKAAAVVVAESPVSRTLRYRYADFIKMQLFDDLFSQYYDYVKPSAFFVTRESLHRRNFVHDTTHTDVSVPQ